MKRREEAWVLVCDFVQDVGLRRHMLAVAATMRWYAARLGHDPDNWEVVGLIHDFDWEIHPDLDQHPMEGAGILRGRGWDEETIRTILSHYTAGTGVEREKPIDFALLACDEVTGLVIATTLVRPSKNIADVELSSLRKKWKDRRFAAGVDREHVEQVTADFSQACFDGRLDLWQHIGNVLEAMQGAAELLELDGRLARSDQHILELRDAG
ncbi:MAG: HDIG domain-containing protein [Chloroflexi bacterium]|nr:HDIG domain-containing protein [Chloroflexota bacterium]MCI0579356.1 HDIG domain-containing protein [Chloroflexota bacterium]MCI0646011.1 HDIG domain-containing protein [Chloroflexota bacterium]MCI0727433.1 HDIG domain-containing protein [Chloroflexota bacterium]